MNPLSVVILTRNEESSIAACIESAKQVSDDIIVVDSGSNDNTMKISASLGARCFSLNWQGYGLSRNFGARQAKHDWIMALDADERISEELAYQINYTSLCDGCIYKFRRENYLGNHKIRFGAWGFDTVKRMYTRKTAQWDSAIVHEKLITMEQVKYKFLTGAITHYGFKNFDEYKLKTTLYAQLCAEKYFLEGRNPSLFKLFFSPLFNFFKSYFFQLGFLDRWKGLRLAYIIACYSWLKYSYLQAMSSKRSNEDFSKTKMNVSPNQSSF